MKKTIQRKEKEEMIIYKVNKEDVSVVQDLVEIFTPFISSKYNRDKLMNNIISFDGFKHECAIVAFKGFKSWKDMHFAQICKYYTKSINSLSAGLIRKYGNNKERQEHIMDSMESYCPQGFDHEYNLVEDRVVNKIVFRQIYEIFIKGKLPKRQDEAIKIFLMNLRDQKEYLKKLNIKPENFRKNLSRAVINIRRILSTEAFKKFYYGSIVLISIICKGTLDEDILFLSSF